MHTLDVIDGLEITNFQCMGNNSLICILLLSSLLFYISAMVSFDGRAIMCTICNPLPNASKKKITLMVRASYTVSQLFSDIKTQMDVDNFEVQWNAVSSEKIIMRESDKKTLKEVGIDFGSQQKLMMTLVAIGGGADQVDNLANVSKVKLTKSPKTVKKVVKPKVPLNNGVAVVKTELETVQTAVNTETSVNEITSETSKQVENEAVLEPKTTEKNEHFKVSDEVVSTDVAASEVVSYDTATDPQLTNNKEIEVSSVTTPEQPEQLIEITSTDDKGILPIDAIERTDRELKEQNDESKVITAESEPKGTERTDEQQIHEATTNKISETSLQVAELVVEPVKSPKTVRKVIKTKTVTTTMSNELTNGQSSSEAKPVKTVRKVVKTKLSVKTDAVEGSATDAEPAKSPKVVRKVIKPKAKLEVNETNTSSVNGESVSEPAKSPKVVRKVIKPKATTTEPDTTINVTVTLRRPSVKSTELPLVNGIQDTEPKLSLNSVEEKVETKVEAVLVKPSNEETPLETTETATSNTITSAPVAINDEKKEFTSEKTPDEIPNNELEKSPEKIIRKSREKSSDELPEKLSETSTEKSTGEKSIDICTKKSLEELSISMTLKNLSGEKSTEKVIEKSIEEITVKPLGKSSTRKSREKSADKPLEKSPEKSEEISSKEKPSEELVSESKEILIEKPVEPAAKSTVPEIVKSDVTGKMNVISSNIPEPPDEPPPPTASTNLTTANRTTLGSSIRKLRASEPALRINIDADVSTSTDNLHLAGSRPKKDAEVAPSKFLIFSPYFHDFE